MHLPDSCRPCNLIPRPEAMTQSMGFPRFRQTHSWWGAPQDQHSSVSWCGCLLGVKEMNFRESTLIRASNMYGTDRYG